MDNAIRVRGLTKRFGPSVALDGLDLDVRRGEVFGFVGPNGPGKTTTIRMLLDLLRPTAGEVRVLGLDPRRDGVAVRRRVGYLPGDLNLPPRVTGREFLADHAATSGHATWTSSTSTLAARLDADLDRPLGELSLGNRRKIGVIAAFAHRPELLVLDEPTSGLDPLVQQTFRALAREAADGGPHGVPLLARARRGAARGRPGGACSRRHVSSSRTAWTRCSRASCARPGHLRRRTPLGDVRRRRGGRRGRPTASTGTASSCSPGPLGRCSPRLRPTLRSTCTLAEPDLEDVFLGYYRDGGGS